MHALDLLAYQSQFTPVVRVPEPSDRQRAIEARQYAKSNGCPTYVSGTPCKYGHSSKRYTGSGYCTECHKLKQRKAKQ